MKKLRILGAVVAAMLFTTNANAQLDIANHLGVGVSLSTNGIGIEASTPLTKFVAVRAGVSFFPNAKFNTDVDINVPIELNGPAGTIHQEERVLSTNVDASMGRTQGHVIFNFYPFQDKYPFYIAAGAYFGGSKIVKVKGHSEELSNLLNDPTIQVDLAEAGLQIGDSSLPLNPENGDFDIALKAPGFRPYFGIGFGQAIPRHRVNFGVELGVQVGKMKPWSAYGDINDALKAAGDDADDLQKVMDKLTIWPVLKFTLNFRVL